MKIVSKQEFYNLPEKIVYSRYKPNSLSIEGLFIKYQTRFYKNKPRDYIYLDLIDNVDVLNSTERMDLLLTETTEFKTDFECTDSNNLYNDTEKFVVYDKEDVGRLIKCLQGTLK